MNMQLSEINNQKISTLICDHLICEHCGVVDRLRSRSKRGTLCPVCSKASTIGHLFFPINFHILVDLTQQAFHSESPMGPSKGPQAASVATILFYCSIREALLTHFLSNMLHAQQIPNHIIDKLLDDNKLANQKFGDLFQTIVGTKWTSSITKASSVSECDFQETSKFMKVAATIRNQFLHNGSPWSASSDFASTCYNDLPNLFSLFVTLHNIYVHPLLQNA